MNNQNIIETTAEFIKEKFSGEGSGHDWWHIYRVWQNALFLAKNEQADLYIVQLSALLHDIADWKFANGDEKAGGRLAAEYLRSLAVPADIIQQVAQIINEVSFKGAGVETATSTLESAIVQDADRLDAIGAIGIARAFAYGGYKGREIYNPEIKSAPHQDFEAYKKNNAPSLNHFYEKLLLLKDRMQTETGRKIAAERHDFMEKYLVHFFKEWDIAK